MANVLEFVLKGRDQLSPVLDSAGKNSEKLKGRFGGLRAAGAGAMIGLGAAVIEFGKGSVQAFVEAQEGQRKLEFAFQQFPAMANVSIDALRDYNSQLAQKTKFDDDAIASGQATLAQFKLTGQQVKDVTPLILDYASRTGKDVPSAAQDVGKALLGNAKALKNIGISYKSTGNATQDYANITALMRQKVGGFAETEGKTAAGQAAILRNQFGELQESVGQRLVPVLMSLGTHLLSTIDFIRRNSAVIGPLAITTGVLVGGIMTWVKVMSGLRTAIMLTTKSQIALNIAQRLSVIGIIVTAVLALAAGLIYAYKHSEKFRNIVDTGFRVVKTAAIAVWDTIKGMAGAVVSAVVAVGNTIGGIVGFVTALPGRIAGAVGNTALTLYKKGKDFLEGLKNGIMAVASGIGNWMMRAPVVRVVAPWLFAGIWLVKHGHALMEGFKTGVIKVASAIGGWFNSHVIQPVVMPFVNAGTWLVKKGSALVAGFENGVIAIARTIGSWIYNNVILPPIRMFVNAGTWLVVYGRNTVAGFKNGIVAVARTIGSYAYNNVIVPVVRPFIASGKWLVSHGANLIGGLKNGIVGQMKVIGTWVKANIVDPIVANVKKFFGIKSPSTVFAGIGLNLVAGLFKGLQKSNWSGAIGKIFGGMPHALVALLNKGLVGIQGLPKKALDALGNFMGPDMLTIPGQIGVLAGANRRVFYEGKALDLSTYLKIKQAEKLLGAIIRVTQGSYSTAVRASGLTHSRGGVFDVGTGGNVKLLQRINSILHAVGFASWVRNPNQGPWPWHVHAVEIGNRLAHPSAQRQVASFLRGGTGLGALPSSVFRPTGFRHGGWWEPGMIGVNETADPEAVFNLDQLRDMAAGNKIDYARLAAAIVAAINQAGGSGMNVHQHFPANGTPEMVADAAAQRLGALLDGGM